MPPLQLLLRGRVQQEVLRLDVPVDEVPVAQEFQGSGWITETRYALVTCCFDSKKMRGGERPYLAASENSSQQSHPTRHSVDAGNTAARSGGRDVLEPFDAAAFLDVVGEVAPGAEFHDEVDVFLGALRRE